MNRESIDFCPYCGGDVEIGTKKQKRGKIIYVVKCPVCGDVYGEDADEEKAVAKFKRRAHILYLDLEAKKREFRKLTLGWKWVWKGRRK